MNAHLFNRASSSAKIFSAVLLPALFSTQLLAHEVIYYGRATGAEGTLTIGSAQYDMQIADVGMSCYGRIREENVSAAANPTPMLLRSDVVRAFAQGVDQQAFTQAEIQNLEFSLPGLELTADALHTEARAVCDANEQISVDGGAHISALSVNGEPVAVTGEPNQILDIPDVGRITLNKQVRYSQEIRVTAIDIQVLDPSRPMNGDVQLAKARAKIKKCDLQ